MFTLLLLIIGTRPATSQSFQELYSDLDNATSISVTQNSIYIVEQGKNRLLKLDHSGELVETIGGKGSGDYEFSKPVDMDATNGLKIFVTDYNNRRVQVFDRRGQYLSSISGRDYFGVSRRYNPTQIAVNDMGEVYFVDESARYIRRFDLDYNLLDEFRLAPEIESVDEIEVTPTEIIILDKATETIHRLELNGSYRGFYPAENVNAMFADAEGLWMITTDRAIFEPESGEPSEIEFNSSIRAVETHYHNDYLFILSPDALVKIAVSR